MKRAFVILMIGSFFVLFGFSFLILYVSEWFGDMTEPTMRPIDGFDYAIFVIGKLGFIIGTIGIIIQAIGGAILLVDRKRK